MKQASKKKIDTIEKLAGLVQNNIDRTEALEGLVKKNVDHTGTLEGLVKKNVDRTGALEMLVKKNVDRTGALEVLVKKNVDLTERLAGSIAEDFSAIDERFDTLKNRLVRLDTGMHNEFAEVKKKLDDIDTRISGLEFKVYGFRGSSKVFK